MSVLSAVATGCLVWYSIVLAVRTRGWAHATTVGSDVILIVYCTAVVAITASAILVVDRSFPRLLSVTSLLFSVLASASLVTPVILGYLQGV